MHVFGRKRMNFFFYEFPIVRVLTTVNPEDSSDNVDTTSRQSKPFNFPSCCWFGFCSWWNLGTVFFRGGGVQTGGFEMKTRKTRNAHHICASSNKGRLQHRHFVAIHAPVVSFSEEGFQSKKATFPKDCRTPLWFSLTNIGSENLGLNTALGVFEGGGWIRTN